MPKEIQNLRNKILTVAKKQIISGGYSATTLRSVAKECGIAVGTVYNYFPSKSMLAATFMLEDWRQSLDKMKAGCDAAKTPSSAFACVYRELTLYMHRYAGLFFDESAGKSAGSIFREKHVQLRTQLADLIRGICRENARVPNGFLPDFIAGNLLSFASEGLNYESLDEIIRQFFK